MKISNRNRNGYRFCILEDGIIMKRILCEKNFVQNYEHFDKYIPCDNAAKEADYAAIWNGMAVSVHEIYKRLFVYARCNGLSNMTLEETRNKLHIMSSHSGWFNKKSLIVSTSWIHALEMFTYAFVNWQNPYSSKKDVA